MVMKKFLNDPEQLTPELLQGFSLAYSKHVQIISDKIVVRKNSKPTSNVAVVTIGGSGYEPALLGYVGEGIFDAVVIGDVFTAPGTLKIVEALRLFKQHAGIFFVLSNHAANVMNANLALHTAEKEGFNIHRFLVAEDIAAGVDAHVDHRRGLVGVIPLAKIAGAAAEEGKSLAEITQIAERFSQTMATLSVTLRTATNPQTGHYLRDIPDDKMDIGFGRHGEGDGTSFAPIQSADNTAEMVVRKLIAATKLHNGDRAILIVNGSGATTLMEQYIIFRKAHQILTETGIQIVEGRCEDMLTVQETAGFQMFLAKLDDETERYYKAPSDTPYWVTQ
jgi:dihydroxyacetone kinase-like protein